MNLRNGYGNVQQSVLTVIMSCMIFPDGSWNLDAKARLGINHIGRYIVGDYIMIVKRTPRTTRDACVIDEKFTEAASGGSDIVIKEHKNDERTVKYGVYGKYMAIYGKYVDEPYALELFQNDSWLMTADLINRVRRIVHADAINYHLLKRDCAMCEQRFTNRERIICDMCDELVVRYLHQRAFVVWSISVGNLTALGSDVCGVIMGFLRAGVN